ncbi:hypothetical protein STENM327S_08352 [Streptomyces tendae]
MRLLVLGGTEFVGRAVVEAALGRGWQVTVLHRGRHAPPPGARALHGDRTAPDGLAALAEGTWDAVVDTWSAAPRAVRDAARLLRDRAGRYVYVSSCSVYAWAPPAGYAEDAPLVEGASAHAGQSDYARDKRGAELAVLDAFGADRSVLVRAGLILGPYENVGRLPWWLNRLARAARSSRRAPGTCPCSTSTCVTSPTGCSARWYGSWAGRTTWPPRRGTPRWAACSKPARRPRAAPRSCAGPPPRPCSPPA